MVAGELIPMKQLMLEHEAKILGILAAMDTKDASGRSYRLCKGVDP